MARLEGLKNSKIKKPTRKQSEENENESSTVHNKIFFIVLALSALMVGIYIQVAKNISENFNKSAQINGNQADTLIIADNVNAGYLDHIIGSLLDFGHKLSFSGSLTPTKLADLEGYNLIWTHDYPFLSITKLEPLQRINHFPGTGFITNKMTLSTTPNVPHILRAFRMPAEKEKFLTYAKQNPKQLWIQKSSSHRGISIETKETVNLDMNDTLIQEYMSNPLLIDGKKFDIGIYAVLTSVEPLRVYIYDTEVLLRFCAHPYLDRQTNKFNSSNLDSYVVGDDYTPIWLMPSLLRYYVGTGLGMKQTLNSYLRNFNMSGDVIWSQIEETIKHVYKLKEHHLARMSRMFQEANNYNDTSIEGSLNQFFEMVRFDFIVDENLNVFLMEANMSPNLSSLHYPPNRLLYEQVLNSYFSLVGLTQFARQHFTDLPVHHLDGKPSVPSVGTKLSKNERYGLDAIISEKDLSVYGDLCVSDACHMNCHEIECKICYFCLDYKDKLHIKRAIFEQHSKWNFKRLLPSTRDEDLELQLVHPESKLQAFDANYIHVNWFRGKCHTDPRFCSS